MERNLLHDHGQVIRSLTATVGLLVLASRGAQAADGVRLLVQPPTLPLVISAPGSYRLRGNITVPDADTTAITIAADNVTLDLNGFSILGPCTGGPRCSPTGSGVGVFSLNNNVTVRNGTVQGMGDAGIVLGHKAFLGSISRVENVRAVSNGSFGIHVRSGATVTGNTAFKNNCAGFVIGANSVVSGNIAQTNGGDGIKADDGCALTGNTVASNSWSGISTTGSGFNVSGNTIIYNGSTGIDLAVNSTVTNNVVSGNHGDGIRSTGGCTLIGNSVGWNTGVGMRLNTVSGGCAYQNNTIGSNNGGTVIDGVDMGNNACDGTMRCP